MKIILASLSSRRLELLRCLGHDVVVVNPNVEERSDEECHAEDISLENAQKKARSVFNATSLLERGYDMVVGADTVVTHEGRVYGKPNDYDHAIRMLKTLSDGAHQVVTSYCIKDARQEISRSVRSEVWFRKLSREEIKAYLTCGEWVDKAGGYGVQGLGAALIRKVEGSITNVIGLPLEEFLFDASRLIGS